MVEQRQASIPDRLRLAREKAGFAQRADATQKFGWSYADYSAQERGQLALTPEDTQKYAHAFNLSAEWLLSGCGEMNRRRQPDWDRRHLEGEIEALRRENARLRVLLNRKMSDES
jgi:transcriptional regulator with XRE-family HTH domain